MGFHYRSEKLIDELRRYAERYEDGARWAGPSMAQRI